MWHSLGDLVATIKGAPQYLLAFTSQGLSSLFHPLARERFNHEGLEHWRGESEEGLDGTANITRTLQHSFQAEYRALEALEDSCQELERRVDRLSEAENLILIDALVREEEFDVTDRQLLSVTRRSVSLLPNLSHAHEVTSTQRAGYGELRSNISQLLRVSRDEKQQGSKDTAQATNKEPHSYEVCNPPLPKLCASSMTLDVSTIAKMLIYRRLRVLWITSRLRNTLRTAVVVSSLSRKMTAKQDSMGAHLIAMLLKMIICTSRK